MNYNPIVWSGIGVVIYLKRIKSYFNDDVDPSIVIDDIRDVLAEEIDYYRGRADDLTNK